MNKNSLIFLSLNELNFDFLKKYLQYKKLNNLRKINDNLICTRSEKEYEKLEPWIQWPTIYTGRKADDHKIFRLGDMVHYEDKTIFNELEELGLSVGAVSSMNLNNNLKKPKYFIPDPWTSTKPDKSFWSKMIHSTISKFVINNSSFKINLLDFVFLGLIFLKFARFKNYPLYFKFFLTGFKYKWRKALFLDLLLNDIHINYFNINNPNFSNIFFNGMAHIQHHYFFNSKVIQNSDLKNPSWYSNKDKDPIQEAFQFYNNILEDYLGRDDIKIAIATGLTQKPYDILKFYYKLTNHKKFFSKLKIDYLNIQELMSRDFILYFIDKEKAKNCENLLNKITLKKRNIFKIDNRGSNLFITLVYPDEIKKNDILDNTSLNFSNYVTFLAIKNGMHSEKGFYYDNFSNYKKKEINLPEVKNLLFNYFNNDDK